MKTEVRLFAGLAVFFAVVFTIYGLWSQWTEPAGAVALILSCLLCAMVAFYAYYTGKKIGRRPEDDLEGEIDEFEGDYGYFVPYSWQPLWLAGSAAICFAGLAIGWWMFIIGATFGVVAIIGWTFESFKGEHSL